MDISENLSRLKADGWCLIEDLIPDRYVLEVRESLLHRGRIEREEWSRIQEQWKSSGHTVPGPEVGRVQDVYSQIPEITEFLTDGRVVAIGESFFGPNMRVSSVGVIITNPGSQRGGWHADWPFNQTMAAHIAAPYQDAVLQLSGIVMVTEFVAENGATLIVPGTHRLPSNPTANIGVDQFVALPDEAPVTGRSGSLLLYDSRLWHAAAPNNSNQIRVAITVRYAPWWLNLEVKRSGSPDHKRLVLGGKGKDNSAPAIPRKVFERFPAKARPFFCHNVES
jgi:hypothetical protein